MNKKGTSEREILLKESKDLIEQIRKRVIVHNYQKSLIKEKGNKITSSFLVRERDKTSMEIKELIEKVKRIIDDLEIKE